MSEIPLITVVDDDAAIREAVQSLLRSVGLRAEGFASAQDFLQSAQASRPSASAKWEIAIMPGKL